MAFIYRYELEDKGLKAEIDLREYGEDIVGLIKDFFSTDYRNILKSIGVYDNYFEYKLHLAVDINMLADINMRIGFLLKRDSRKEDLVFRRMTNKYIAFIQEEYLDSAYRSISSLELIDYELYRELESVDAIGDIDLFTLRFRDRDMTYYASDREDFEGDIDGRLLIVEGNYGSNSNYPKLTGFVDGDFLENYRDIDKGVFGQDNYIVRNFIIKDIRKAKEDEKVNVDKILSLFDELDNSIDILDKDCIDSYRDLELEGFRVYDVGQGLRQAVYNVDRIEKIYLDMGIDKYSDILNYSRDIKVERDGLVILSHLHLDHWHMLNVDIDAYYQDYIIPNQEKGFLFAKRCSEILRRGKKIYYMEEGIELPFAKLYLGRESRFDNKKARHKHETGIYSILKIKDRRILVTGDQRYDYMKDLGPIDILIASHHGGDYSKYDDGNTDYIPRPRGKDSILVYSYGEKNPYGHPSKIEDYKSVGWKSQHHTAKNGDYIL